MGITRLPHGQSRQFLLSCLGICLWCAESLAEEVCQGSAAAGASDAHAAASSSENESGTPSYAHVMVAGFGERTLRQRLSLPTLLTR